jgi:hypothetical protein
MFISRAEKNEMQLAIRMLQAKVRDLEIESTWLKNKVTSPRIQLSTMSEAPWGLRKDGYPKKRPGRPPQVMEVSA